MKTIVCDCNHDQRVGALRCESPTGFSDISLRNFVSRHVTRPPLSLPVFTV